MSSPSLQTATHSSGTASAAAGAEPPDASPWRRRWVPLLFTGLIAAHVAGTQWAQVSDRSDDTIAVVEWTIDAASWTLSSLAATLICLWLANAMPVGERRTWRMIGFGCACWCLARLIWDYNDGLYHYTQGASGALLKTPHWTQLLFVQYPVWLMAGLLWLPKPDSSSLLSVRQLANLALLVCTFASIIVFTIFEPAVQTERGTALLISLLVHGCWYALAAVTALHMLWGYRWQQAYWPLMLLLVAMTVQVIAFFAGAQHFIAGYADTLSWVRLMSSLSFTFVACAASEHAWELRHGRQPVSNLMQRERWLEAVMPAFLMAAMTASAVINVKWITPRSMTLIGITAFIFCVVLALREWWVQGEESRLIRELNASRDELIAANARLLRSEQQLSSLNADLEHRVVERTGALASAYRELESFSYAVAHDIKAPLRTVHAFSTLLSDEFGGQLPPEAQDYLQRMRAGVLRTSEIVDDLLAYARVERAELQSHPIALAELVERCVTEQSDEIERNQAIVEIDVPRLSIVADPSALTQVLRNLLQNALKFSRDAHPPRVEIAATCFDRHVRLQVSDNGIGFDMQFADQIFALFKRLHRADEYSGTGIGLAIARKAVERMGGKLWAESALGRGARFHIELPVGYTGAAFAERVQSRAVR